MWRMFSLTCWSWACLALSSVQAAEPEGAPHMPASRATPPARADEGLSPFMQQRRAVAQAAQAKRWDEAMAQARQLLALTLPDGNPYEQLDASELLFVLQHQQGLHRENLELADRMLVAARSARHGAVSGQVSALAQRGLMAAMMLQDHAAVLRYQQQLHAETPLFPAQWTWERDSQRLHFETAQLSAPTLLGRWVLVAAQGAHDRTDHSSLRYMYVKPNGQRMFAQLSLNYDDGRSDLSPSAQREQLAQHLEVGTRVDQPVALAQPALRWADGQHQQQVWRVVSETQPESLRMHWVGLRGNWWWELEADMQPADHALAVTALQALWQSLQWPKAPALPHTAGQPPLPWRESTITSAWRSARDWPKAAALARAALPDARFPSELARLHTVAGIAAFKAGQYPAAEQHLQAALKAWPYAQVFDSTLLDNAQQYGAAMALRRGEGATAAALLRQYLRNAGGLHNVLALSDDPQQAWLDNRRTGMGLPMQAAGFYLQEPETWERIQYRDLATEFTMGLTSGMRVPESAAQQEALLRKALEKQFQLQAGTLRKQRFVSKLAQPGQAPRQGERWVFDVQPLDPAQATTTKAPTTPVQQVLFWWVDQGTQRAMLRASVSNAQQARQAQQLADALRW